MKYLVFSVLLFAAGLSQAQTCDQVLCDKNPQPVLISGKAVIDVGWLGGGIGDANKACAQAPMPKCAESCPNKCCDSAPQRRCELLMYRGQSKGSSGALLNQAQFYVPPTTFPCTNPGAQSCPEAERLMAKSCTELKKTFGKAGEDWSQALTRKSQGYADWDGGVRGDPQCKNGSGLFKMSADELSCQGDKISALPQTSFHADCLVKNSDGHQVSIKISAVKKCIQCSVDANHEAHK